MAETSLTGIAGRRQRLQRLLGRRRLPLVLAGLAMLLASPSLWLGLQVDDFILRVALVRPPLVPEAARSPLQLFAFMQTPDQVRWGLEHGSLPWWTEPDLRLAFFRPLTGITHWIDFRLWPGHVWLMHVQSLLWLSLVVAVVALLFRRLLQPAWLAGLAGLFFALDDAHGMPAAWLANRNALIAVGFGVLALIAHDRWRREGWRLGMLLAPLALAAGLAGGEMAVAAGGYLLAYAALLDKAAWRSRLASLLPCGLVGVVWASAYRAFAYGTRGSAMYVDPIGDPLRFGHAAVERAPLLLLGQWLLPSELHLLLSAEARRLQWLAAIAVILVLAVLLAPLLRHDRTARFLGAGMLLALVPACGTYPDDRLLLFAGVGGAGLLAQFLAGVATAAPWLPRWRAWRRLAIATGWVLLFVHLVLAPIGLARGASKMRMFGDVVDRAARSFPHDAGVAHQQVLIVQTPAAFVSVFGPLLQATWGHAVPTRTLVLGSGIHSAVITRRGERSLQIRPEGGFLLPPGQDAGGGRGPWPAIDPRYMFAPFDRLYRDAPMGLGARVSIPGMRVEVTALTPDGRPAEATFTLDRPLDDPGLRWVRWEDGVYVPFPVPAVGTTVTLPPAQVPFFGRVASHGSKR